MNRPFVLINVAMTADGKIDTFRRTGAAISSARDKERVDRLRAESDAVMVGGKVGIVSEARLQPESQFLTTGPARIVIFTTRRTSKHHVSLLESFGVDIYLDDSEKVNLPKALETLKQIGVERLMVEGGATLNFDLLRLGLVDEVTAYVAPMVFGGADAPTLAGGPGLERSEAIPLKLVNAEAWEDGGVLLKYILDTYG
jgi:2,5-diamino-6-(ribosylamino)-4(3H)-pyrimidinone 5'-phosphate reductase